MAPPIAIATTINPMPPAAIERDARPMVAASAIVMPPIPNTMPERDVSCFDSPARLRMNNSAATMYAACETVSDVTPSVPDEHVEHAPGHGKAAEDVDAGHEDRQERQHGDRGVACPICSNAPTTMIPEIALVTDINGVCNAWWTLPIT